jgi:hypothetical protein
VGGGAIFSDEAASKLIQEQQLSFEGLLRQPAGKKIFGLGWFHGAHTHIFDSTQWLLINIAEHPMLI